MLRVVVPQRRLLASASERRNLFATPLIYSLLVPFVLLDLWVTVFQWTCFPLFRVARVPRRPYFVFDRYRLPYLTALERLHCTYCSYATGVVEYVREIGARTEQYWCPITHARSVRASHARYDHFIGYGDASRYRRDLATMRRRLRPTSRVRRARIQARVHL